MENPLPEVCACCHKLKLPHLGKRVKKKGREHDRRWVCYHCLGKPKNMATVHNRSPLELEARRAVMDTGYHFQEEYELGPFRYDLAVPALRLLVEVDSRRWHSHPSRITRDRRKEQLATKEGWLVARVSSKRAETISFLVRQAVMRRESQLTIEPDR